MTRLGKLQDIYFIGTDKRTCTQLIVDKIIFSRNETKIVVISLRATLRDEQMEHFITTRMKCELQQHWSATYQQKQTKEEAIILYLALKPSIKRNTEPTTFIESERYFCSFKDSKKGLV